MAHKTLIGGTAYEISGGKTLIGGTAYSIAGGRTLVGGTGYDISFGSGLISFTIAGTTYQAEDGMTWAEWVASSYNTGGVYYSSNISAYCTRNGYGISGATPSSVIVEGYAYTLTGEEDL